MKKRILSMMLAVFMVMTIIPFTAISASAADTNVASVTVNSATNGTVASDKATAVAGDTVTLTVTPDEGYVLDKITVTDKNGDPVTVTDNQFTMPAGNVTVSATFRKLSCIVAGSFSDWDTANTAYKMTFEDGKYVLTTAVKKGDHEFKIVIDGVWYSCGVKLENGVASNAGLSPNNTTFTLDYDADVTFTYDPTAKSITVSWGKLDIASVTTDAGTTNYSDFASAIAAAAAAENSELKLLENIEMSDYIEVTSGKFTVNLNGKTWASSNNVLWIGGTADIKITDTEGGVIRSSGDGYPTIQLGDSSKLDIVGGTLEHTNMSDAIAMWDGGNTNSSQLTVSGGTIKTNGTIAISAYGSSVTVTGGTIESTSWNIWYQTGVIDLSGHPDPTGIKIANQTGADVTVSDSTVKLPAGYAMLDENGAAQAILAQGADYTVGVKPVNVTLEVTKEFNDWSKAESFTFNLAAVSAGAPMPASTTAIASEVTPLASFGNITFNKEGTFEYTITEVDDGINGIIYDKTAHQVIVTVTKGADNTLTASVTYDGEESLIITNTYTHILHLNFTPGSGTVTSDKDRYAAGETVTLTITPNEYYELYSVILEGDKTFTNLIDQVVDGKFTFTMPDTSAGVRIDFDWKPIIVVTEKESNTPIHTDGTGTLAFGKTYTVSSIQPAGSYSYVWCTFDNERGYTPTAVTSETFAFTPQWYMEEVERLSESQLNLDGIYLLINDFIVAEFKIPTYTVTVDPGLEHVTVTPDKTVAKLGETVTLTVTPEEGYKVEELFSNNDIINCKDGVYSFVMPAEDVVIGGVVEIADPIITVEDSNRNAIPTDGTGTMTVGEAYTIHIVRAEGYTATVTWVGSNSTFGTITNHNVAGERFDITANVYNAFLDDFSKAGIIGVDGISLTVHYNGSDYYYNFNLTADYYPVEVSNAAGGSVTADKTEALVGEIVALTVIPDAGYELGAITVTDANNTPVPVNGRQFIMPEGKVTVSVTFKQIMHENKIEPVDHVTLKFSNGQTSITAPELSKVSFTVSDIEEGYILTKVVYIDSNNQEQEIDHEGEGIHSAGTYSFTVPLGHGCVIKAVVCPKITTETVGGGKVDPADDRYGVPGKPVYFTVEADIDYMLDTIIVSDGTNTIPVTAGQLAGEYTFTMPEKPVTIKVSFKGKYVPDLAPVANGSVSLDKQSAAAGEIITVKAIPAAGYQIDKITVTDENGDPVEVYENTFMMPAGKVSVTVTFKVECGDRNRDHACDCGCGRYYGSHRDSNKDHICDYGCYRTIGACIDRNQDHLCDYGCGRTFKYLDEDTDHLCDCGCQVIVKETECVDADKDHYCDHGCGKYFGEHVDTNKDHVCDYKCGERIGECVDEDRDHFCDHGCGRYKGTHADNDHDHKCDYGCARVLSICKDSNKDHKCDFENCEAEKGVCADVNKDHYCDYGCDKTFGKHEDTDEDGKCDHGCKDAVEE